MFKIIERKIRYDFDYEEGFLIGRYRRSRSKGARSSSNPSFAPVLFSPFVEAASRCRLKSNRGHLDSVFSTLDSFDRYLSFSRRLEDFARDLKGGLSRESSRPESLACKSWLRIMDDYGYKSWHGSFHAASSIRTACFTSSGALRYSWQVVVYTGGKGGRSNARLTRNVIDYIYIRSIHSFDIR